VGFENRQPGGNAEKKYDYKIIEMFLERVKPQTKADRELQLKLQRQAHTCGNALLAAVLFSPVCQVGYVIRL